MIKLYEELSSVKIPALLSFRAFIRHSFPLHFKQMYAHHFSYSAISFLLLLRPS